MTDLDPARHKLYQLELKRALWRASFYPRATLQNELLDLYLNEAASSYGHRMLPKDYLGHLISLVGDIYAAEFPPELPDKDQDRHLLKLTSPSETYALFLRTFLKSLVAFTANFPAEARVPLSSSPSPIFTTPLPIFTDDLDFTPEIRPAFRALTLAVQSASPDLQAHGIFPPFDTYVPYAWDEFNIPRPRFRPEEFTEPEPVDDKYDKASWRERKREHDRHQRSKKASFEDIELTHWDATKRTHEDAHRAVRDITRPWEEVFFNSPFFKYRSEIARQHKFVIPFDVPDRIRFRGMFCCAPQGRGKTNLLRTMVESDRKRQGCIIIMDAKGDLIDAYRDKAFVIEPSLSDPPQINPLALGSTTQAVDLLEYVFSSVLENKLTPVQSTIFHSVLSLATLVPDATIATVLDILREGPKNYQQHVSKLDPEDQMFFLKDWDERHYKDRRPEIIQRIRLLTRNPYIRAMFNSPKNTIDFGKLMDGQNLIVVDNSYDPDMLGDLGCEFFGRLVIALVRAAAFKRAILSDEQKNPVYFYIDEAHTVIKRDATVASILRQCRSQKIAMTFANQAISDYEEGVRGALMDCGIFMVNPGNEASAWAHRLNLATDDVSGLRGLPDHTFAAYVEGVTPSAVNISVPWLQLPITKRKPQVAVASEHSDSDHEATPPPEPPMSRPASEQTKKIW